MRNHSMSKRRQRRWEQNNHPISSINALHTQRKCYNSFSIGKYAGPRSNRVHCRFWWMKSNPPNGTRNEWEMHSKQSKYWANSVESLFNKYILLWSSVASTKWISLNRTRHGEAEWNLLMFRVKIMMESMFILKRLHDCCYFPETISLLDW